LILFQQKDAHGRELFGHGSHASGRRLWRRLIAEG
jgi:hypothetical protein